MNQALPALNHMQCLRASPSLPYTTLITCYAPWSIFDRPNFVRLVETVSHFVCTHCYNIVTIMNHMACVIVWYDNNQTIAA